MVGRNLLADPRAGEHEILTPGRKDLDLRDGQACIAAFKAWRPDVVVHCAAVVGGIQANINEPVRFLADNALIGLSVLEAARQAGVGSLLNIGSSCMYPRDVDGVLDPSLLLSAPLEPTNEGYALAKILSWKLAEYMRREQPELQYKTIVPCNLYGPHDDFDPLRSHLVPAAMRKVLRAATTGEPTVDIWGDGQARREFMYAGDLADFIWTWLPRIESLPDLMNVGVGKDHTVTEYYQAAAAIAGFEGRFVYDATKPVGMRRKLLDVSAQEALGWRPTTGLEQGMRQTIEHQWPGGFVDV